MHLQDDKFIYNYGNGINAEYTVAISRNKKEDEMKKLLAVIMCMFMLISLIPFSVSAAEKVVYVKDGGMGDGTTAEKAVGSIREAVEAVGTKGGTIVVCGLTTIADAHKDFAPW